MTVYLLRNDSCLNLTEIYRYYPIISHIKYGFETFMEHRSNCTELKNGFNTVWGILTFSIVYLCMIVRS